MRRAARSLLLLSVSLPTACALAPTETDTTATPLGEARSAIINGEPDLSHPAVVALLGARHACSATIVATHPPDLYLLTAAHCVGPHAPSEPSIAVMGRDYAAPDEIFDIVGCRAHPAYDGEVFDFAMCRATGATEATPFIAPAAAPDELDRGTAVLHVGYGVTERDAANTTRYAARGQLTAVEPLRVWYGQSVAGPCSGDSGGPQLSLTEPERVVGVTSFGDMRCTKFGASGRVSAVYDSFIEPFIAAEQENEGSCESCYAAATSELGTCAVAMAECVADESCRALGECLAGCETESCRASCRRAHEAAELPYAGVVSCICNDGCAIPCARDVMCEADGGGDGPSGGTGGAGGTGNGPKADAPPSDSEVHSQDAAVTSCAMVRCAVPVGGPWVLGAAAAVWAARVRRRRRVDGRVNRRGAEGAEDGGWDNPDL